LREKQSNLEGEQVLIRKLRFSDAGDVFINLIGKDENSSTSTSAQPYPGKKVSRIIRRAIPLRRGTLKFVVQTLCPQKIKKEHKLGIVLKETGRVIGVITFSKVDRQNRCAEIGFWIGKKYWGHGFSSEAVRLALKIGFEQLELHRIYAWTYEKHIASRKVMERCGFKLEGTMREAVLKDNTRQDILNYGILKSEYRSV
jgi:RimJ/RimL family protein N-acetyltransferase